MPDTIPRRVRPRTTCVLDQDGSIRPITAPGPAMRNRFPQVFQSVHTLLPAPPASENSVTEDPIPVAANITIPQVNPPEDVNAQHNAPRQASTTRQRRFVIPKRK